MHTHTHTARMMFGYNVCVAVDVFGVCVYSQMSSIIIATRVSSLNGFKAKTRIWCAVYSQHVMRAGGLWVEWG